MRAAPKVKAASGLYGDSTYDKPIRDHSDSGIAQAMREIHEYLDRALRRRALRLLHCHAGIGRTGTVLGCYFVHRRNAPRARSARSGSEFLPARECAVPAVAYAGETDERYEYVLSWRAPERPAVGRSLPRREDLERRPRSS